MKTNRKSETTTKQIRIIIERSEDSFSAYAENVEGIYGQGNTVDEAKQSALDGLDLLIKYNTAENIPTILKANNEIVFKYDAESF